MRNLDYSPSKSFEKAIPVAVLPIVAGALSTILQRFGIDVDYSQVLTASTTILGIFAGLRNWKQNRKK